jgi:hypothetical protein
VKRRRDISVAEFFEDGLQGGQMKLNQPGTRILDVPFGGAIVLPK